MTITRQDLERIYDELDRRMDRDIRDALTSEFNIERYIREERKSRLQGVYGTIMVLVSDTEWREIVWWIDDIERERYGEDTDRF